MPLQCTCNKSFTCTGETVSQFGPHSLIVKCPSWTGVIVGVLGPTGAIISQRAGHVCKVSCTLQTEVPYNQQTYIPYIIIATTPKHFIITLKNTYKQIS